MMSRKIPLQFKDKSSIGAFCLRLRPQNWQRFQAAEAELDGVLPRQPRTLHQIGKFRALCLGPDEWWLFGSAVDITKTVQKLEPVFSDGAAHAINMTAGWPAIGLSGPALAIFLCKVSRSGSDLASMDKAGGRRISIAGIQIIATMEFDKSNKAHSTIFVPRSYMPAIKQHIQHLAKSVREPVLFTKQTPPPV